MGVQRRRGIWRRAVAPALTALLVAVVGCSGASPKPSGVLTKEPPSASNASAPVSSATTIPSLVPSEVVPAPGGSAHADTTKPGSTEAAPAPPAVEWVNTPYECMRLSEKESSKNPALPKFPLEKGNELRWVASYVGCRWTSVPFEEPVSFSARAIAVVWRDATSGPMTGYPTNFGVLWGKSGSFELDIEYRPHRGFPLSSHNVPWAEDSLRVALSLAVGYVWVDERFPPVPGESRRYLVLHDARRVPLLVFEDARLPKRNVGFQGWYPVEEPSAAPKLGQTRYRIERYFAGGWHELPAKVELWSSKKEHGFDHLAMGGHEIALEDATPRNKKKLTKRFAKALSSLSLEEAESAKVGYFVAVASRLQQSGSCLLATLGTNDTFPAALLAPTASSERCSLPEPFKKKKGSKKHTKKRKKKPAKKPQKKRSKKHKPKVEPPPSADSSPKDPSSPFEKVRGFLSRLAGSSSASESR